MTSITEGTEYTGESGKTYLAVSPLGQDNVWTAVQKDTSNIVVLKAPSNDDTGTSWPRFQHEMIMHELFKGCKHIREQVDRVSPQDGGPPILVLEISETTLWQARTKRPLSKGEIRSIGKAILQGLQEVHDQVCGEENDCLGAHVLTCAYSESPKHISVLLRLTEMLPVADMSRGLVYVDMKMQNIMIDGFDTHTSGDGEQTEGLSHNADLKILTSC